MENFLSCGEILDKETFQMWGNLRCGEILGCGDILDVEKFYMWRNFRCAEISYTEKHNSHYCEICFVAMYAILLQNHFFLKFTLFCRKTCFVAIYAVSMWRKIQPKILSVEKK